MNNINYIVSIIMGMFLCAELYTDANMFVLIVYLIFLIINLVLGFIGEKKKEKTK